MLELAKRNNGAILLLMLNVFLAFAGITLVIPILPTYMNVHGISGTTVGFMVAMFALSQFLVAPYAGSWADQYGRKMIIVIGLLLFVASALIFGLADNVPLLFLSRMLGGVASAFITPAVMAYVVDITTDEDRAMGMGWIGAAISTGFIMGPALGGFLAEYGLRVPFFAAAAIAAVSMVASIIFLPEPNNNMKQKNKGKVSKKRGNQLTGLVLSYKTPYFIGLLIILITSLGLAQYETVIGLFVDHKYGYTPGDIAWMIMIGALVGAVTQLVLFGPLINKLGEKRLIVYCFILIITFMIATIYSSRYWMMVASLSLVFVGVDFIRPAVSTYFSRIAGNDQGYVAGMNTSYTSLGNIIGPILAGTLFDLKLELPFWIGSAIIAMGWLLSIRWLRKPEKGLNIAEIKQAR